MKTRILPILLAITLLMTLSACGGLDMADRSEEGRPPAESDSPVKGPDNGSPVQSDEALGPFNRNATLAETVLLDEGGVKITATGLNYTAYSVDLELTLENNSGKDLCFVSGSLGYSCNSVNGYMVKDGYLNCSVANGKKANDTISFRYDTLLLYGIDKIADMEIGFSMTDAEYNTVYSGPRQLNTSAFDTHDYSTDHYQETITSRAAMNTYGYEMLHFSQDTLYSENGVTLLSSGLLTSQGGETSLLLELENTTDKMVYLSTSDIALNGLQLNSSTWSNDAINPGNRAIITVALSSVLDPVYWNVYGITDVSSVTLSLEQRSEDGIEIAAAMPVEIVIAEEHAALDATGTEVYNKNGLRIVAKAILEDPDNYSEDLYVLLLAENSSSKTLTINDAYDSLSVNGVMTDYSYYGQEVETGESAALTIQLWRSSLEATQITTPRDIQEIEARFEIKDGYTTLDEPTLTLTFGEED